MGLIERLDPRDRDDFTPEEWEQMELSVAEKEEAWVFVEHSPKALYNEMLLDPPPFEPTKYLQDAGFQVPPYSAELTCGFLDNVELMTDGDFGFNLMRDGMGIAVLSFYLTDLSPRALMVCQIQGKKGRELPSQWERNLLRAVELWAADSGIGRIRMPTAEKVPYYNSPWNIGIISGEELEAHQRRFRMRYDVTARRSGYKRDPKVGNYLKIL